MNDKDLKNMYFTDKQLKDMCASDRHLIRIFNSVEPIKTYYDLIKNSLIGDYKTLLEWFLWKYENNTFSNREYVTCCNYLIRCKDQKTIVVPEDINCIAHCCFKDCQESDVVINHFINYYAFNCFTSFRGKLVFNYDVEDVEYMPPLTFLNNYFAIVYTDSKIITNYCKESGIKCFSVKEYKGAELNAKLEL